MEQNSLFPDETVGNLIKRITGQEKIKLDDKILMARSAVRLLYYIVKIFKCFCWQ